MNYLEFRVKNYKGIRDTKIDLRSGAKTRAFSLIGLNESGKTTLLEAIYSFSPDPDNKVLFGSSELLQAQNKDELIPKGQLSDFSDSISVIATVSVNDQDINDLVNYAAEELDLILDSESVPREFNITSSHIFKESQYLKTKTLWDLPFKVKSKRQRNFRKTNDAEWQELMRHLRNRMPTISYFPTSVFKFPERIYLSGHSNDELNNFYKKIFQDILDFQGEGLKIDSHIVNRIRGEDYVIPYMAFWEKLFGSTDKMKIDQVIDKASAAVTNVIFSKWNEIFKEEAANKEVHITWNTEDGSPSGENKHDAYVAFHIKDGTNRYSVADRSLGFRWFFCFLLFTQFRAHRREGRATLFLFDEPASNLHAKAQEKLLESFPKICEAPNSLIYSTHSHYMVEPKWLEHAYIVENRAIEYDSETISGAYGSSDATDIRAIPYKKFVAENPSQTSYFQPILDKLDVKPSGFDLTEKSLIVEGKSDYYIISYFMRHSSKKNFNIVPGLGANTLETLISLMRGWNYQVLVLLDSDGEGLRAKQKYQDKYFLNENEIADLSSFVKGAKEIENLLADDELQEISKHFGINKKPNKKQICSFFQEHLATNTDIPVSKTAKGNFNSLAMEIEKLLGG